MSTDRNTTGADASSSAPVGAVNPAEVIAEALAKHADDDWGMCRGCGWKVDETGDDWDGDAQFVAHQASVIAALPNIAIVDQGKRWHTAAYRADNGNIIPVGVEYVKPAWAEGVRDEWQRDEPNGKYFVAYRDVPDWQEVER